LSGTYGYYSENELLALLKTGDAAAFSEIFSRYKAPLYHHALLFWKEHDTAGDIVQDVFARLWEKREGLEIRTSLSAYLHRSVKNATLNHLAKREVAGRYLDSLDGLEARMDQDVEEKLIERELFALLQKKIDSLPEKMKNIFLLSREQQLSHVEISEKLDITTKTVRQQIYNAVKLIRAGLSI